MSREHFVVTGAQGATVGGLTQDVAPNRLEIYDLIKNHQDQFSLYIQALTELQNKPQSDPRSYFGVGGIHGLPFEEWQSSGGTTQNPGAKNGYCTHNTVLFPTWHRPYVALHEQLLQEQAVKKAEKYQDQDRWLRAAQNLRAPYWDWATNSIPPPEVISLERLDIITPNGKENVPNPLFQYNFKPIHPDFNQANRFFRVWTNTIRFPTRPWKPDSKTDVKGLTSALETNLRQTKKNTYELLTNIKTWSAFSNSTYDDNRVRSNSLEAIHDNVHGTIGGHMGDPAVAGFDPIFFLHHCNVDRILALWTAINPGVGVSEGPSYKGTWTIPASTDSKVVKVNENTSLTPFWSSQTTYWNSRQTTETGALRYSYPEFNGLDLGDRDAVKASINKYVDEHYKPKELRPHALLRVGPSTGGVQATPEANTTINWSTRVHVKKFELSGSFTVLIFLGDEPVPKDPEQWNTSASFVGSRHVFVNSAASGCDNCRTQEELVVEGFVPLDLAIEERSGLSSYEPREVIPYLKGKLDWRIHFDTFRRHSRLNGRWLSQRASHLWRSSCYRPLSLKIPTVPCRFTERRSIIMRSLVGSRGVLARRRPEKNWK